MSQLSAEIAEDSPSNPEESAKLQRESYPLLVSMGRTLTSFDNSYSSRVLGRIEQAQKFISLGLRGESEFTLLGKDVAA